MQEGTTSRVMVVNRPYGEFYHFYSVRIENFGYHLVCMQWHRIFFFFFFSQRCNPCGFWPAQISLSILSRKVLQSAVASGASNPQLGGPVIRTFQLPPPGVPSVWNDTSEPQQQKVELWARNCRCHLLVLLYAVNLWHGTDGFTSPPKEGTLRNFLPEKSDDFSWVWTRELGYQRPARSPLDHWSRWHRILPLNILQQKSVSMMWVFLNLAANSVNIINEGDKCYILCCWSCYEHNKDWTSFSNFGFLLFVDRITKLPLSLCKESAVVFFLSVLSINRTLCQDTVSIFS